MHREPDDDPFDRSEFFEPAKVSAAAAPRAAYPLVYPVSRGWKVALVAFGLLIAVPSVLGMVYFSDLRPIGDAAGRLLLMGLAAAFVLIGAYYIAAAFLTRVTLHADALEYRGPLRALRVARSEIASYRFRSARGITSLDLQLSDGGKAQVGLLFARDVQFAAWLAGLTNTDEALFQAAHAEVAADATLGNTPEERLARARRIHRGVAVLGIVAYLMAGAALFSSHPALVVALLALPWLAIGLARRSGSAVSLGEGGHPSVRADISPALVMPAVGLAIIALQMSNLEDWPRIITPALVAAAVMLALVAWAVPRMSRQPARLARMSLFLAIYAASTLAIANLYLDTAPPKDVVLDVSGKFTRDTRSGTNYYLLVLPWGTTKAAEEVKVNADFYRRIQPGQEVCIHNHAGAFGLPWHEVDEASDCNRPFGGPGF